MPAPPRRSQAHHNCTSHEVLGTCNYLDPAFKIKYIPRRKKEKGQQQQQNAVGWFVGGFSFLLNPGFFMNINSPPRLLHDRSTSHISSANTKISPCFYISSETASQIHDSEIMGWETTRVNRDALFCRYHLSSVV